MLKSLFKKEEKETIKLCDLKIETSTDEQIKASCATADWADIEEKIAAVNKFIHNLPQASPDETNLQEAERRRNLAQKIVLLRNCQNENENRRKNQQAQNETKSSEEILERELPNLRYSYDPLILTLKREGTGAIPLNAIDWKKTTSPLIPIPCMSGETVTMNLKAFTASHWRMLTEHRFSLLFLTAENPHLRVDGKKEGLFNDTQTFKCNKRIIAQPTIVALFLV